MPLKKAYKKRTYRKRPAAVKSKRTYRKKTTAPANTATIVETLPPVAIILNLGYQFEIPGITGDKPIAICEQFGLYRIAKVVHKFTPFFDTYTSAAPGPAASVPNLLWKMNRYADKPPGFVAEDLRNLGAKPIRFDDKTLTVSYRPNILLANATAGSVSGSMKMSPWINTDTLPDSPGFLPSTTNHYGHFYVVEGGITGTIPPNVGTVQTTITYEFKLPRTKWSSLSAPVAH